VDNVITDDEEWVFQNSPTTKREHPMGNKLDSLTKKRQE
jgi:hypothetical protein